mmetsp:Transcript_9871/g.25994  ORF Transcript_9871/g.25994 Transcript_9871/m.25994 type:complete len:248 (-) Transcript_9871:428-1171(-)
MGTEPIAWTLSKASASASCSTASRSAGPCPMTCAPSSRRLTSSCRRAPLWTRRCSCSRRQKKTSHSTCPLDAGGCSTGASSTVKRANRLNSLTSLTFCHGGLGARSTGRAWCSRRASRSGKSATKARARCNLSGLEAALCQLGWTGIENARPRPTKKGPQRKRGIAPRMACRLRRKPSHGRCLTSSVATTFCRSPTSSACWQRTRLQRRRCWRHTFRTSRKARRMRTSSCEPQWTCCFHPRLFLMRP